MHAWWPNLKRILGLGGPTLMLWLKCSLMGRLNSKTLPKTTFSKSMGIDWSTFLRSQARGKWSAFSSMIRLHLGSHNLHSLHICTYRVDLCDVHVEKGKKFPQKKPKKGVKSISWEEMRQKQEKKFKKNEKKFEGSSNAINPESWH